MTIGAAQDHGGGRRFAGHQLEQFVAAGRIVHLVDEVDKAHLIGRAILVAERHEEVGGAYMMRPAPHARPAGIR
jgi:hypothetical protein